MLCIPALLYLVYTIIYILIDVKNNSYNNMIIKIWISIMVFALLYFLCSNDLTVVAWFIVCIPFIYMILVMAILMYVVNTQTPTSQSSTSQPSTAQPSTVQPSTVQPSTTQPSTTQPSTVQPFTTKTSTTHPFNFTPQITFTPLTFQIGI